MAFYKDGRAGGADPDTGRKRCERQGHPPGFGNFPERGLTKAANPNNRGQ